MSVSCLGVEEDQDGKEKGRIGRGKILLIFLSTITVNILELVIIHEEYSQILVLVILNP